MTTKLTIIAFSDEEYKKQIDQPYSALINPEGLTVDLKVQLSDGDQGQGQASKSAKYVNTPPPVMNFDLLFDATGVVDGSSGSSDIATQIDSFMKLAFTVSGEQHQPNFLKLVYGDTLFKGRLEGVSIVYKLFKQDGKPLRAVLKCNFKSSKTEKVTDSYTEQKSPDLTHLRVVRQGDTLPLMCYEIYNDSGYYIQVAKVNRLVNFRNLKPGTELYFPPLSK